MISLNPSALDDSCALDRELGAGSVGGPRHGIPILVKDQIDAVRMPTTLGSVLFKDYGSDHDATVVARLRAACRAARHRPAHTVPGHRCESAACRR